MPNAELSEILFIAMMFIVVTIISTVSIYLFVRQYNREKGGHALKPGKLEKRAENEEAHLESEV